MAPLPAKGQTKCNPIRNLKSWQLNKSTIQRYGQASCANRFEGGIWIAGGFGVRPQGHGRLDDLIFVSQQGIVESKLKDKRLARLYHSLHFIQSKLIVYGGRTHPAMALGDLGFIDTENNRIEWLDAQAGWPQPRWRHASTTIHPYEIFIGGGRGQDKLLSDCWVMRVQTDVESPSVDWAPFLSLPSGRHSAMACYWSDSIIISGGLNELERLCQAQMLVSSMTQPKWTEPVWNGPSPIPRYSHQALVTSDDRLVLVGGISTCHPSPPGVCVIHLQNWICVEYCLPVILCHAELSCIDLMYKNFMCPKIQDIGKPVMLTSFNAQLVEEEDTTKIFCWGGGSPCFSFGTHLNEVYVELTI